MNLHLSWPLSHRHHFVPLFYLRRFASESRRINVYNLRRRRWIAGASLRDQCYRRRFYVHQELEDLLARTESEIAPTLARLIDSGHPPDRGSSDHQLLFWFVSLQLLRTVASIRQTGLGMRQFTDAVFAPDDPSRPEDVTHEHVLELNLKQVPMMVRTLTDLHVHVVHAAGPDPFITSDQPVFRYNAFCEGVSWSGVTGGRCSGLQIFLPLSPTRLVVLYDGHVYKAGSRSSKGASEAKADDMSALNGFQAVSAHQNLYASSGSEAALQHLYAKVRRHRGAARPVTIEAVEDGRPDSSLIHQYYGMPNLRLTLSFLRLRRNARRTPLSERARMFRDGTHSEFGLKEDLSPGTLRRFTVQE